MMEKKYQHMMEQVNMDEGFASGLLERIREGRPKRRPRPLRTALIAACVCLALVGTAVAASDIIQQYFHTQVVDSYDEMIPEQSDGEESAIRFTAPSDNWPNQTADEAQADAAKYIGEKFGTQYLPPSKRVYKSKSNAQDGHEAIRPTMIEMSPDKVKDSLSADQYKLYKLI